eukprot:358180-Chlamydomonas_euryale.AAC.8
MRFLGQAHTPSAPPGSFQLRDERPSSRSSHRRCRGAPRLVPATCAAPGRANTPLARRPPAPPACARSEAPPAGVPIHMRAHATVWAPHPRQSSAPTHMPATRGAAPHRAPPPRPAATHHHSRRPAQVRPRLRGPWSRPPPDCAPWRCRRPAVRCPASKARPWRNGARAPSWREPPRPHQAAPTAALRVQPPPGPPPSQAWAAAWAARCKVWEGHCPHHTWQVQASRRPPHPAWRRSWRRAQLLPVEQRLRLAWNRMC